MLPLLILALVAGPLVEIAVITQILVWAPWSLVLAVIVVGSLTGVVVLRQHGLANLQRWRTAQRRGDPVDPETVTEGLRDVAGVLLAVPGVVTTIAGLILLAHPLRRFVARRAAAAGKTRRERLVPRSTTPTAAAALPPPPPRPALEPAGADISPFEPVPALWDTASTPVTGHIAGQSNLHGAVADDFFEAEVQPRPVPQTAQPAVQPAALTAPQTSGWSPGSGAPAPPQPPDFMWAPFAAQPEAVPAAPGAGMPAAAVRADDWDTFMTGRDWEDEPTRKRKNKRKGRRGGRRGEAASGSGA